MTAANEHIEKTTQSFTDAFDKLSTAALGSTDAIAQCNAVLAKGCEEYGRTVKGLMEESVARAMTTGKAMSTAKSLREVMDLQTEFLKDCFDTWVAGTGQLSEISTRCSHEAIEPVAKHANAALGKFAPHFQNEQSRAA